MTPIFPSELPRVRILGLTLDGRPVTVTETEPYWRIDAPTTPRTEAEPVADLEPAPVERRAA